MIILDLDSSTICVPLCQIGIQDYLGINFENRRLVYKKLKTLVKNQVAELFWVNDLKLD